jgi:hypothetical protein
MVSLVALSVFTATVAPRPPLLIHVMPWFSTTGKELGWHWIMNRTSDEMLKSGRVASHFRPLIGAYDSLNPDVLELQILWMKIAGFDGVLADWYGENNFFDYPMIHERTKALFQAATKAKMSIGMVYEDQAIGNPIRLKLATEDQKNSLAKKTGEYLRATWLKQPNWFRVQGKPVVMVFGPQSFGDAEWGALTNGTGPIQLLTLHQQKPYAQGGFDWPVPAEGFTFNTKFGERAKGWGIRVPVAYPRFQDYYDEGGQKGYPDLPDRDGKTYREQLANAIQIGGDAIQVATWNDWQEGTQIEPSIEFGMRDLVETQRARRRLDPAFRFTEADLQLPYRLYRWRMTGQNKALQGKASAALFAGDLVTAKRLLKD